MYEVFVLAEWPSGGRRVDSGSVAHSKSRVRFGVNSRAITVVIGATELEGRHAPHLR